MANVAQPDGIRGPYADVARVYAALANTNKDLVSRCVLRFEGDWERYAEHLREKRSTLQSQNGRKQELEERINRLDELREADKWPMASVYLDKCPHDERHNSAVICAYKQLNGSDVA